MILHTTEVNPMPGYRLQLRFFFAALLGLFLSLLLARPIKKKACIAAGLEGTGGDGRDRTADLLIANQKRRCLTLIYRYE